MPLLYNLGTKSMENVDENQIDALVAQGNYQFRKGVTIPVLDPQGNRGTIDAAEATEAFRNGFRFETQDLTKSYTDATMAQIKREEYDSPITAGIAGFARGATLGLSDVGLRMAGLSEAAKAVQEVSPVASTVGEIGGTLTGALTGIGPAGLATKAGVAVTESIAGKLASSAVSRLAAAGAGSAVEGALFGAGQVVSESALGDPEMSAAHIAQTVGLSAALGGGIGAFGKGASMALSALKDAVVQSTLPGATAEVIGKAYAKVMGIVKSLPKDEADDVVRMFTKDRNKVLNVIENPQAIEQQAVDTLVNLRSAGKQIDSLSMDIRDAARAELDQFGGAVLRNKAKYLGTEFDKAITKMENRPSLYDQGTKNRLIEVWDIMDSGLKTAKTKGDVHRIVEEARKNVDKYMKFGMDVSKGVAKDTEEVMKGLRSSLKEHLEDTSIYGKFGEQYSKVNKAYSAMAQIEKEFDKQFTRKIVDASGNVTKEIDETKVLTWLRNPEAVRNANRNFAIEETTKKLDNLGKVAEEISPLVGPEKTMMIRNQVNKMKATIDGLRDVRVSSILINRLESMTGKSLHGIMIGGAAGTLLGDKEGGFAGALLGAGIANPKTMMKIMARIEGLSNKGNAAMSSSVQSFFGKPAVEKTLKAVSEKGPTVTIGTLTSLLGHDGKDPDSLQTAISNTLAHPENLDLILTKANPSLDAVAPATYAQLHATTTRALQYIQTKIPQPQIPSMDFQKLSLSKSQQQKLEHTIDAAFRPARLLEEIKAGTPTKESIEAVQIVHPRIFEKLRQSIMESATNPDSKMSYKQKLTLGVMFGMPTIKAMNDFAQTQSVFQYMPTEQEKLSAPHIAEKQATAMQRIENG